MIILYNASSESRNSHVTGQTKTYYIPPLLETLVIFLFNDIKKTR